MKTHFFFFVLYLFALIGPAAAVDFARLKSTGLGVFNPSALLTFGQALTTTKLDNFRIQDHKYFRIQIANGDVRTYLCSTTTTQNVPVYGAVAPYSVFAVDILSNNNDLVILTITPAKKVLERMRYFEDLKEQFEEFLSNLATQIVAPLLYRGISVRDVGLGDIVIVHISNSNSETFQLFNPNVAKPIKYGESKEEIVMYAISAWFGAIYNFALHKDIQALADLVTSGSRKRTDYFNEFRENVRKEVKKLGENVSTEVKKHLRANDVPTQVKKNLGANVPTEVKNLMLKDDVERAERMLGDPVEVSTAVETRADNLKDVERRPYDVMEEEPDTENKTPIDSLGQICRRLENRLKYKQRLKEEKDIITPNENLKDICERLEFLLKGQPGAEWRHPLNMETLYI